MRAIIVIFNFAGELRFRTFRSLQSCALVVLRLRQFLHALRQLLLQMIPDREKRQLRKRVLRFGSLTDSLHGAHARSTVALLAFKRACNLLQEPVSKARPDLGYRDVNDVHLP